MALLGRAALLGAAGRASGCTGRPRCFSAAPMWASQHPRQRQQLAPAPSLLRRRRTAATPTVVVAAAAPAAAAAAAALTPAVVFDAATLVVLPFYVLMAAAPKARLTQRLFSGTALFAVAAVLYGLLLALWGPLPQLAGVAGGAAEAVAAAARAGSPAAALRLLQPQSLAAFAELFGSPSVTALAWLHLVLLDLFQARWVYRDGQRNLVPTWHSAILCFMVGPLGLLCHLATKAALRWWRTRGGGRKGDDYVIYRF